MADKTYLDQEGLERLVQYINDALRGKANTGDIPEDVALKEDLADFLKRADVEGYIDESELAAALDPYATQQAVEDALADYATSDDLADLRTEVTALYHFKGNVADLEALQAIENPHEGDVYNIGDTGINAAWVIGDNGEGYWDEFGGPVDLSDYMLKEEIDAIPIPTVDAILYGGASAMVSDSAGIKAMLANDEPEVEITLTKDMPSAEMITVPEGKKVTLDLGGNKMSSNSWLVNVAGGDVVLKNGVVESSARPVYVSKGTVTLEDGAVVTSVKDVAINATGAEAKVVMNGGKVNAQESGVLVTSGASVEMNGGEIECTDNCPIQGNGTAGQGDVNIVMNGGKLTAHITSAGYIACGVYMPNSGSFTMNGGEIESDGAGIVMRGGKVNLNAGSVVANGAAGVLGKVGDSRVVVGPYAVVYDANSKYPAMDTLGLTIGAAMRLEGTDGDLSVLPGDGTENIVDNRQ